MVVRWSYGVFGKPLVPSKAYVFIQHCFCPLMRGKQPCMIKGMQRAPEGIPYLRHLLAFGSVE